MWDETVFAYFDVLVGHWSDETIKNQLEGAQVKFYNEERNKTFKIAKAERLSGEDIDSIDSVS
jgi:hypothetical protein